VSTTTPATAREPFSEPPVSGEQISHRISKESLSQQAYLAIRGSLMRSRLRPGQRLVARQLAADLGISVTPVRESLLRLVSEHAREIDERGTLVVPTLDLHRCKEVRDLRVLTEGEGAARAAVSATDAEIDGLAAIHARYIAAERGKDFTAALTENENFHFELCRLARSPVLFRIVENLWIQFGPVLSHLYDKGAGPFHGETHRHLLVIDGLRDRDPEKTRSAIGEDILIGGKAILEQMQG
jgi:DNA-binding GntR family transcriptional regulator